MSFLQALTDGVRDTYCSALNASADFWSLVGDGRQLGTVGPFPLDPADAIAQGLGVGSGLFCNTPPVPPPDPPFQGGQCDTAYTVMVTYTRIRPGFPSAPRSGTLSGLGPISSIFIVEEPNESGNVFVGVRGIFADGERTVGGFEGVGASGQNLQSTVTRDDGQPDDCGDPGPQIPPVPPNVTDGIPTPITFVDEGGDTVNLTPTLFYGNVVINANLDATIPVDIQFDADTSLSANLNLTTGDINFNIGSGSGQDETACPPTPDDTIPDPPEGEENQLERIVAVRVNVSFIDMDVSLTEVLQDGGNPDVWLPDLGLVQFLCPSNPEGGNAAWTPPVRVQSTEQIIACPIPWGAIRVSGTARQGVTWQLTSIRGTFPESSFP